MFLNHILGTEKYDDPQESPEDYFLNHGRIHGNILQKKLDCKEEQRSFQNLGSGHVFGDTVQKLFGCESNARKDKNKEK